MIDSTATSSRTPVAFVSGASGGIGAAICRRLVEADYRVVATARKLGSLQALQRELGDRLLPMALDVTDAISIREVVLPV
jgi:3-hydroxy acid dehydrogenase / malonic semialdehyde reductase